MRTAYRIDPESPSGLVSQCTGKPVGCVGNHGYYQVGTRRFGLLLAHRVVWELIYGPIPEGMEIDHIDRDRKNNALSNLRLVTSAGNSWNTSKHSDNKTGHTNISFHQKGYAIEVMRHGKRIRKVAKTLEEALKIREEILNVTSE